MSDQFLGEIRIFAGNFAPYQWALCDGQILPISQYAALFSLLGTNYGGNGQSNFGLPNLQAAGPLDFGAGPGLSTYDIGETGGATVVTVLQTEMPIHNHKAACDTIGGSSESPVGAIWAEDKTGRGPALGYYSDVLTSPKPMNPLALGAAGGGQPHNNLAPYLVLTFIIALSGVFPARG
jgi:microcystin-dependent protein